MMDVLHVLLTLVGLAGASAILVASLRWMQQQEPDFSRPHPRCWPSVMGWTGLGLGLLYSLVLLSTLHGVTERERDAIRQARRAVEESDRMLATTTETLVETETRYANAVAFVLPSLTQQVHDLTARLQDTRAHLTVTSDQLARLLAMASPEHRAIMQVTEDVDKVSNDLAKLRAQVVDLDNRDRPGSP